MASARARPATPPRTPLAWAEVPTGLDRRDFAVRSALERVRAVGDPGAPLRASPGADLSAALRYAGAGGARSTASRACGIVDGDRGERRAGRHDPCA